jgi:hypothetical protein
MGHNGEGFNPKDEKQMGKLVYGPSGSTFSLDDRILAHLQSVVIAKLRRGESFVLNLDPGRGMGQGRRTVWVQPSLFLEFRYDGGRQPALDRGWVEQLMNGANSAAGLNIAADFHLPGEVVPELLPDAERRSTEV